MKIIYGTFIAAVLLAIPSNAEPPRQRQNQRQNNFFQRQLTPPAAFTPSGWQPQRNSFSFPSVGQRQQQQPQPQQPPQNYGPPPTAYGPPSPQPETTTDNQDYTNINSEVESIQSGNKKNEKQIDSSLFKNTDRGFYYVYLPDGRLQRVVYMTSADLQNMAYTARVQYEDVDPVAAPIYSAVNRVPVLPGERLIVQEINKVPVLPTERLIVQEINEVPVLPAKRLIVQDIK